jgi:lipopolysaccharide biosynthesis glycosyltransferase
MQEAIDSLNLNQGAHKLAAASYARLFLGTILPECCQRVLYLDCDTIVQDSLKKLWNVPMDHALIAGVQDTVDKFFLKVIHLPENTRYVNAGVLLVNLKAWREENVQQKFMDVIARFHGNVPHHDQGTINAVCRGRKIYLPVRYNMISNLYSFPARTIRRMYFMDRYYSQKEIDRAKQHPAIVHFTTGLVGRPWEENCTHPERESFWETVKASPWSDMGMQPDRRKKSLKAFTFVYHHMPRSMFEVLYRSMSWALHLRK